jgi:hypothetical protein
MGEKNKFTNNSADVIQKINLSLEIDNIEEIIKKESEIEIKKIKQKGNSKEGYKKTFNKNK